MSLISPRPDFNKYELDTAYGASIFSYARIAHIIRTLGVNVNKDLPELFARMVLNILVINTDDHLKNTGFIMDENKLNKYHLAPLYDVVTQENHLPHMIHIGLKEGRKGTIKNALSGARQMGIKENFAKEISEFISNIVSKRRTYYENAGMSEKDINMVNKYISEEVKE